MSKMSKTIAILGVVAGLGVAALPLSSYAAPVIDGVAPEGAANADQYDGTADGKVQTETTVQLTIEDKLSIEAGADTVTLAGTAGATAGLYTHETPLSVTVITKNAKGYDLTIVGSGEGTNVTSMYAGDVEIETGAFTAADDTATKSTWGYGVAAVEGSPVVSTLTNYQAVPTTATPIMSRSGATTDAGDVANVSFAANVISSQAAGTYTGQVTFTATNKN